MLFGVFGIAMLHGVLAPGPLVPPLKPSGWLAIAYLGMVCSVLAFYLWSKGLELATPTGAAVTVTLNPVSAMLAGLLVLGEQISPWHLVGLAGIAVGIGLVAFARDARPG